MKTKDPCRTPRGSSQGGASEREFSGSDIRTLGPQRRSRRFESSHLHWVWVPSAQAVIGDVTQTGGAPRSNSNSPSLDPTSLTG